jgi:chaperone modulatory protein CbpM
LIPEQFETDLAFSEADIARVQLITDLTEEMGVNREGVGIILHLLDQVYGLRSAVADLLDTAKNQAEVTPEKS